MSQCLFVVCCTWYFPVKDASRLTLLDPCPAEEALVSLVIKTKKSKIFLEPGPKASFSFQVVSLSDGEYVEAMHTSSQVSLLSHLVKINIFSGFLSSQVSLLSLFQYFLLTFSTQDICSTEPLAHVDFYPNGGLAQV